jgi:DnaK suppressor protein
LRKDTGTAFRRSSRSNGRVLLQADQENYLELAGRVSDLENSSLADRLIDVSLAAVDRAVDEVRDIDAALRRIANGSYGRCTECGEEIETERVQDYPRAKPCLSCQATFEDRGRNPHVSSSL